MNPWDALIADLMWRKKQIDAALEAISRCRELAEGAARPNVCMVDISRAVFRSEEMRTDA